MTPIMITTMVLCFALTVSVAVSIGLAAILGVQASNANMLISVKEMFNAINKFPLAAIPLLIALGAIDVPGMTSLLILSPFLIGGWFGLSIWRGRKPRRRSWLYAFTDGFVLSDDPRASAFPVRWSQVTDVSVIWTVAYEPGADGEGRPVVSGYSLRCTDGQALEIPRSFQNVRDPYGELGRSLRRLLPIAVGDTMPQFPTIDEVVAVYAPRPTGS